ncbi:DNA-directed RNA polymerase subunit D [Candidatus Pacearchaeota archaeon]|nr:MAG: DNA-directed RNA polymerase subunit D [Candidatus Pacearchaeota archaeon]
MEIIKKNKDDMVFKTEINENLANAIRRHVNKIPVLGIDEVEIIKNGSALYDEVVAHRLGLIPLKSEKINEKTTGELKLVSKQEGMVKSGELQGNVKVIYDEIPITFLDKGQELELRAIVKAGKGQEHVKFSPGLIFYRKPLEIIMDKECLEEVKKICPDVEIKEKDNKIIIQDEGEEEIGDVCEGICNKTKKKVEIKEKPGLIMTVESFGQMPVEEIVNKSVEALKKDLTEISKKIK